MEYHELLRMQYRLDRYLKYLKEEELIQRGKDIMNNFLILTEDYKIGLRNINEDGKFWFIAWTHVLEEIGLRYGHSLDIFKDKFNKDFPIPNPIWPINKNVIDAIKNLNLIRGSYLIKYGKIDYLKSTYGDGNIRIFPASFYNDASLNPAIMDNELEFHIYQDVSDIKIETVNKIIKERRNQFPKEGHITIKSRSSTDYYVYCLSSIFDPRLFGDFEANSCLIIKDPRRFIINLMQAFKNELPEWISKCRYVQYIDPIDRRIKTMDDLAGYKGFFKKHFRYYYQQEFRIICSPAIATNSLEPIDLKIGSLYDYCDLFIL